MKTIFQRGTQLRRDSLRRSSPRSRESSGGIARINARYLLKSPLEFKPTVGRFKALKMNACPDERRMAKIDSTREQYHEAGPIQNPSDTGGQEKHPMTAAARIVLCLVSNQCATE